jgi:hypothetical protein
VPTPKVVLGVGLLVQVEIERATRPRADSVESVLPVIFHCPFSQAEEKKFELSMARPEGFEPPTPRSVVWCSVQLSYGRLLDLKFQIFQITELGRLNSETAIT